MLNKAIKFIKKLFNFFGYSISKSQKKGFVNIKKNKKVNVGCGNSILDGYINCDSRYTKGVDLICSAWELSKFIPFKLEYIYCRHMLEHLTLKEVQATLDDWYKVLDINGCIEIIVPNLPFHINQFLNGTWSIDDLNQSHSNASWGIAGLYGWQRECDPMSSNYNNSYWDVHKIGFDEKLLRFLLMKTGYANIKIEIKDDVHLIAKANKLTLKGERQVSPFMQDIRIDHRLRYELAKKYIKDNFKVLDVACGIGYGSYILKREKEINVVGVDIDGGAIKYANEYYKTEGVEFNQLDILKENLEDSIFDVIVCFETIEHIKEDRDFLKKLYSNLKKNGKLIISTPNQLNMPYSKVKFPFHIKHYKPEALTLLLKESGFCVEEVFSQQNGESDTIKDGWEGCFNIVVCGRL